MEETQINIESDERTAPERIGFGRRLGAYLLDLVISGILGGVIGMFAGASLAALFFAEEMGQGMGEAEAMGGAGLAGMIGGALGTVAGMYLILLVIMLIEAFTGQTLGKMILGIKNGTDMGSAASSGTLITRAVIKYIGTIMALIAGLTGVAFISSMGGILGFAVFIGCFFVLADKRQAFHDMIAKTAVYNKSDIQ